MSKFSFVLHRRLDHSVVVAEDVWPTLVPSHDRAHFPVGTGFCALGCIRWPGNQLDRNHTNWTMRFLGIFIAFPWLALLPALTFAAIGFRSHRTVAWVAAAAWLLYAAYEAAMARRILCSGECNIRVDLLLLYPVLVALSLAAAFSALRARRAAV
jgi:hypothetical protein